MKKLIKVSINPAVTAVVFIENGKFLKIENSLSGQDLQISQEAKRFLGKLILRDSVELGEVGKQLEISQQNKNIIQLKDKVNLLGGGGGSFSTNKIHPNVTLKQMKNCQQCKKIETKCAEICEVAQDSVNQIIQYNSPNISFLQQMKDVELLLLTSSQSFTQPPQCYANRLAFKSLCRLHIRFQFMSEMEINVESKESLKKREDEMKQFCSQLKVVDNVCPILDLYFFSCLIGMFYQFREPSQKQNPSLTQQVMDYSFWILSGCIILGDIASNIIQENLGGLASQLGNLMQHAWQIIQGHQYSKLYQGMMNHWINLGNRIVIKQYQKQSMRLEEIILFYMDKFLEEHRNRNISVCVYILMEIDYILQVIISRKSPIKFDFKNIKFQEFIDIIAQDNKENKWLVQIKEFYCLMAYSTLTRYAQLSILLSLNYIIRKVKQQESHLGKVLQMSIMRRFLVEPDQNVKILIDLDDSLNQFQKIVKEQGKEFWKKYIESNQFRDQLALELQEIKSQMKYLTDAIQKDATYQFEKIKKIQSPQEYLEEIIKSEDQAVQRYLNLFNATQRQNYGTHEKNGNQPQEEMQVNDVDSLQQQNESPQQKLKVQEIFLPKLKEESHQALQSQILHQSGFQKQMPIDNNQK